MYHYSHSRLPSRTTSRYIMPVDFGSFLLVFVWISVGFFHGLGVESAVLLATGCTNRYASIMVGLTYSSWVGGIGRGTLTQQICSEFITHTYITQYSDERIGRDHRLVCLELPEIACVLQVETGSGVLRVLRLARARSSVLFEPDSCYIRDTAALLARGWPVRGRPAASDGPGARRSRSAQRTHRVRGGAVHRAPSNARCWIAERVSHGSPACAF